MTARSRSAASPVLGFLAFLARAGRRAGARIAVAALLAAAGLPVARAQAGADCDPAGDQQQMNACAVRDFQRADIRLNIRYREAMESLPADRRVALRQEQRQWLRSRDADCKAETRRYEGGSAWPLSFHRCLERATARRTAELDRGAPSGPP